MTMRLILLAGSVSIATAILAFAAIAAPPPGVVQFATPAQALPAPTKITLFEKPNFQGRSMTFERRVASLNAVGFNDAAQSVKIEGRRDWVLCESRNFLGRCIRVHLKEKDLMRQKFTSLASSIYPVPEPVAPPPH
ncbi:MAG: beta/gamma crystallin-related protein [Micropepsaceae bacterium]